MTNEQRLECLLDTFETIESKEEIWDPLFDYVKSLGVDAMGCYHLPPPGALDFDEKFFVARGLDEEDVTQHRRNHNMFANPLEDRSRPLMSPIFWSKICSTLNFTEDQWLFIQKLYSKGHLNGVVIPVHGHNGRNGCVVLRFEDARRQYTQSEIRRLQWAAQCAHQKFCKLHSEARNKPASLTAREQEILTWVARGKSNSVIADIIGISQHTVNGYLRRIYLKTGTSDRTTASLRGIGEALIGY